MALNLKTTRIYSNSRNRNRGYSLIEFAVTLPFLFMLVLGAIDLNSALQAYTAVQEGVRTAVRCSTTTDGDCTEIATAARTPFHNWVAYQGTTPDQYFGYKHFYGGTEHFMRAPVYRLSNFSAHELDEVSLPYITNVRNAAELEFPADGVAPTIFHSYLPRVRVNRVPNVTPTVEFRYQRDRDGNAPGSRNYRYRNAQSFRNRLVLPNIRFGTRDSDSRTVSFTIPTINSTECRVSRSFNQGRAGDHGPSGSGCRTKDRFYRQNARLVVYIEANSRVRFNNSEPNTNVTGNVQLDIPRAISTKQFGGRTFGAGGDASLCPRGVPNSLVHSESGCNETMAYNEITVQRGKKINLKFTLNNRTGNGRLIWETTKIHVYYPEFAVTSGERESCKNGLLHSQFSGASECVGSSDRELVDVKMKDSHRFPNNYSRVLTNIPSIGESRDSVRGPKGVDCALVATALGRSQSSLKCEDYFEMNSNVERRLAQKSCPENTGQGVDKNGAVYDSKEANKACSPPDDFIGTPETPTWETRPVNFNVEDRSWQPDSCNDNSAPLPREVRPYKNLTYDTTMSSHSDPIYLGKDIDPRIAVKEDPYSCSRWGGNYMADSTLWNYTTRKENFFHQTHFEYLMGCDDEQWKDSVRDKLVGFGMNPRAFNEPWRGTSEDGDRSGEIRATVSEEIWEEYGKQCSMPFYSGQPDKKIGVYQGSCDSPQMPPICDQPDTHCIKQFAGFCGDGGESTDMSQNTNLAAAEAYFYGRLQSTYPSAKLGCEGSNCVNIREVPATSDAAADGYKTVAYEGEITTPLLLTKVFGADNWTFRYSDERVMESELSR